MMSVRALLVCAVLVALLLVSASVVSGTSPVVGAVSVVSTAEFSDPNDSFGCLTLSGNGMKVFAASGGGDISYYTVGSAPSKLQPLYIPAGSAGETPDYVSCQADATTGTSLWLLDTRGSALYLWSFKTPTVAPLLIASFPDEQPGAMQAMALDLPERVAYVGTRSSDLIYVVNLNVNNTAYSAFDAYSANSDITAMVLSSDRKFLYYAAPAPAEGAPGSINKVAVNGRKSEIMNLDTPTVLYSSTSIVWPDTLALNLPFSTVLYWKDGGGLHGTGNPTNNLGQSINQLTLPAHKATTLYSTSTDNLPTGLGFSPSASQLLFTTTTTISELNVKPILVSSSSAGSA